MTKTITIYKDAELDELLALCPAHLNLSSLAREAIKQALREFLKLPQELEKAKAELEEMKKNNFKAFEDARESIRIKRAEDAYEERKKVLFRGA